MPKNLSLVRRTVFASTCKCSARTKRFYPLSKDCVCHNMKATTLGDVLGCLQGTAGQEITVPPEIAEKAVRCIDRMMELSQ